MSEIHQDMEDILREYYRRLEEIQVKTIVIESIKKNTEEIRRILLDVDELIPKEGVIAQYEGTSSRCSNVCETSAQTNYELNTSKERLEKELAKLLQRKVKLKMQLVYLESAIEGITFALSLLDPSDRTICEQCYGLKGKSNLQISLEVKMDEKTIRNRRQKIKQELSRYLHVNPDKNL